MNKNTARKRFMAMGLDIWIFLLIATILMLPTPELSLLSLIGSYIFYFGVIPTLSKGSTCAALLFGLQIVSIQKTKAINVWVYLRRALLAIKTVVFSMWRVKINASGQTQYDEKFATTIIERNMSIEQLTASEYFILPYFLIAFMTFFAALALLSYILSH